MRSGSRTVSADVLPGAGAAAREYEAYARPELSRLLAVLGLDLVYTRARGDHLYHVQDGRERAVLDLLAGYGACLLGHHHPELVAVARRMLDEQVPVHAQASARAGAGELARALSDAVREWTGSECVTTLASTGAEAIEAAIKLAELARRQRVEAVLARLERRAAGIRRRLPALRPYMDAWLAQVREKLARPPVFLALTGAFHGKTTGALSLTSNPAYREPFAALGLDVEFLPRGDVRALEQVVAAHAIEYPDLDLDEQGHLVERTGRTSAVAALFVEPVQGEGGIHVLDRAWAEAARTLADRAGFLLVSDEIQAGMGRTGSFLAARAVGLAADAYAFAKALGGGLAKVAALTVVRDAYPAGFSLLHTSTFAEDEPSCRIALKAVELVQRDGGALIGRCRDTGAVLSTRLMQLREKHPGVIAEVRGLGLMVGVQFARQEDSASRLISVLSRQELLGAVLASWFLHQEGIRVGMTLSESHTLRIEPSAHIALADLERFLSALDRVCAILARADSHALLSPMLGAPENGDGAHYDRKCAPSPFSEARVAFLGHYIEPEHVGLWEPALAGLPAAALERFFAATGPVLRLRDTEHHVVRSATGAEVSLAFVGLSTTAAQIAAAMEARETGWILEEIEESVAEARAAGCSVVGFGGFTSIVTGNCTQLAGEGIGLTTGNALTVGMTFAALEEECRRAGIELASARVGVLGATGNIASVLAELIAAAGAAVTLVGRPGAEKRLTRIAERMPGGAKVATGMEVLARCDVIVAASNSPVPLIFPEHLKPGPVVICDVAIPSNVSERVLERPDVAVFQGGVVQLPGDSQLVIPGVPLPPGQVFACMAETLLLGLAGHRGDFAVGPVARAQVERIMALAREHGFRLAASRKPCNASARSRSRVLTPPREVP